MHSAATSSTPPIGTLLRDWRLRRRLSQLDLAGEADVSTRHLSYLETGRAEPSREMVLRLADRLDVPLRERNRWLAAAGFAPMFAERRFDDPALAPGRAAVGLVLEAHSPWPAIAVDRHWNMVAHNAVVPRLIADSAPELLQAPLNVLRLSLHPRGLAPRIANLREWRHHIFSRLDRQIDAAGDVGLAELREELARYPVPEADRVAAHGSGSDVVVPLVLDSRSAGSPSSARSRCSARPPTCSSRRSRWRPSCRPTRRRRRRCAPWQPCVCDRPVDGVGFGRRRRRHNSVAVRPHQEPT